jgi:DNA-binding LytR/AlgR family response regulator
MRLKTIIVEDEPLAQHGLADYIADLPFLDLVGTAEDPLDALDLLTNQTIDLMFLDIQMPKMTGLDLLRTLKNPPLVIITTAYKDYALEGYAFNIVDYLIKPIPFERFTAATMKAKDFFVKNKPNQTPSEPYFFIKCDTKLEKIYHHELLFIEADANYVTFHTLHKKYLSYLTIKNVEDFLPTNQFVRIHKSYLVAIDKIQSIDKTSLIVGQIKLPLSRNYRDTLLGEIDGKVLKR